MGQLTKSYNEKCRQAGKHRKDEEPDIILELFFISKMEELASVIGVDKYGNLGIYDFRTADANNTKWD